jgi:hypothetical protein
MKIYKYWVIEKALVKIDQTQTEINCYGGSNISQSDAVLKAREKIEKVKRKLLGDAHVFDEYEVEIREEIVRAINARAIVTRNRYGAQVLNVQDLMIMDIDEPKRSFWDILKKRQDDKTKIVEMVRTLSQKYVVQGCGFRIYETSKGMRVIVLGKAFDPKAATTRSMMKEFNCDALYTLMCKKQDCFRARLTPKPGRMKLRGFKVKFPHAVDDEMAFQKWLSEYETASRNYAVCKFIEQIGPGSLTEEVRLHDEISGAYRSQALA